VVPGKCLDEVKVRFGLDPAFDADEVGVRWELAQEFWFAKQSAGDERMMWPQRCVLESVLLSFRIQHLVHGGELASSEYTIFSMYEGEVSDTPFQQLVRRSDGADRLH